MAASVGQRATGLVADIEIARQINAMHGFGVIAAWEIGQLDEGTVDALLAIRSETQSIAAQNQEVQAVMDRIRAEHRRR